MSTRLKLYYEHTGNTKAWWYSLKETIKNYDFTWTDIQKPTRENISTLGSQYPFHELNLDDCLSKIHIPKVDKYKDHLFILLNFPVNMREEKHGYHIPKVSQLAIFVGINYLITIHESEFEPLAEMFQLCKSNEAIYSTSLLYYQYWRPCTFRNFSSHASKNRYRTSGIFLLSL
jgi:Mg2+ and Co2+ transporter CorA